MEASTFLKDIPAAQRPLWQIRELSEIYVDSLVTNPVGELMFMSAYGRDGALQQLLSAFHLPRLQGGIDRISLIPANEACEYMRTRATVGEPKRLTKLSGKLPRGCFGPLSQTFIYDEALIQPDFESGKAWVLSSNDDDESGHHERIWAVIRQLLPIPVLDHWRDRLLTEIWHLNHSIVPMDKQHGDYRVAIGHVRATFIQLDQALITDVVSRLVRCGELTRAPRTEQQHVSPALAA